MNMKQNHQPVQVQTADSMCAICFFVSARDNLLRVSGAASLRSQILPDRGVEMGDCGGGGGDYCGGGDFTGGGAVGSSSVYGVALAGGLGGGAGLPVEPSRFERRCMWAIIGCVAAFLGILAFLGWLGHPGKEDVSGASRLGRNWLCDFDRRDMQHSQKDSLAPRTLSV